jgi:hypothetical protein
MAAKKRKSKKRTSKRRKSAAKKPRAVKKKSSKRSGSRRSQSGGIAKLKSRIRANADERLKDGLYLRDKATTRKAHKNAQSKIDKARADLRRYK